MARLHRPQNSVDAGTPVLSGQWQTRYPSLPRPQQFTLLEEHAYCDPDLSLHCIFRVALKTFSLEDHLGNAWRMICGQKTYEVELLFDADFAENIADTARHKTQKIDWLEDGSIRFRCKVDGLDEIQWWILCPATIKIRQ